MGLEVVESADGFCPVCEQFVREWLPFARHVGQSAVRVEPGGRVCPHCGSMERMRHIFTYFRRELPSRERLRMLHIAPEPCLEPRLRLMVGSGYKTCDFSDPKADFKEDLRKMSQPDACFDLIYCSNVLEHIDDDASSMRELFRILAPNGLAIIQVPIRGEVTYENPAIVTPEDRTTHFGQADHVRYYGLDIKQRLGNAGFSVEVVIMPDFLGLSEEDVVRMNMRHREPVHFCRK